MSSSSAAARRSRTRIADAGLILLEDEVVAQQEPEGELAFHWLLAQKPRV
jgi:hypothetical protein